MTRSRRLRSAIEYLETARGAFGDACGACGQIASPSAIVKRHADGGTTFGYTCDGHGAWTCWYATEGIPMAWRL